MDNQLIAELYSTLNSPEKWPPLLDRLHPMLGAKAAGLIVTDFTATAGEVPNQFGVTSSSLDKDIMTEYNRDYAKYEAPIVQKSLLMKPGEMVTDPDFDDIESVMQRPDIAFVRENLGVFHRFGVRLNDEQAWHDIIAFQYGLDRGNATHEEFSKFAPYFYHIAQAVSLGRMYDSIRQKYSAVLTVLDRINIGMLLLRSDSVIILRNECANETIDRCAYLKIDAHGRLNASGGFSAELKLAVETIANTTVNGGKVSNLYIKLGNDENNDSMVVELSPLIDSGSEVGSNFKGVLVLLIDPKVGLHVNKKIVQKVYSLSQAETEIAQLVATGLGYESVAERRSVSLETVKSQSKALMRKMQTSGRAGIIKKILSLGLPFRN